MVNLCTWNHKNCLNPSHLPQENIQQVWKLTGKKTFHFIKELLINKDLRMHFLHFNIT